MSDANFDPDALLSKLRHEEIEGLFDFLDHTQFWIKDRGSAFAGGHRAG